MSDKKTASLPTHTRHRAWLTPHYRPVAHAPEAAGPVPDGKTMTRASDALDELQRRRLPDGRWQPGGRWWKPPGSTTTPEVVDWGRSGPNEMITLNALRVLKAAGHLTLPAIPT